MQNEKIYSDILESIKTVDDLELLVNETDTLLSALYEGGSSFEEKLNTKVRSKTAYFINNLLSLAKEDKEQVLNNLKKKLTRIEVLRLTLAFDPSNQAVEDIHNWVYANISKSVVLDIKVDKMIIGGAIIAYKGKYKDYSVRKKFDKLYERIQANTAPQGLEVAKQSNASS